VLRFEGVASEGKRRPKRRRATQAESGIAVAWCPSRRV
jgi:hypothetical protein